jgi:hypothetical protein
MTVAAVKTDKARRAGPLDGLSLDQIFAEARYAYSHLPPSRQRRLVARIVRQHVLRRLRGRDGP